MLLCLNGFLKLLAELFTTDILGQNGGCGLTSWLYVRYFTDGNCDPLLSSVCQAQVSSSSSLPSTLNHWWLVSNYLCRDRVADIVSTSMRTMPSKWQRPGGRFTLSSLQWATAVFQRLSLMRRPANRWFLWTALYLQCVVWTASVGTGMCRTFFVWRVLASFAADLPSTLIMLMGHMRSSRHEELQSWTSWPAVRNLCCSTFSLQLYAAHPPFLFSILRFITKIPSVWKCDDLCWTCLVLHCRCSNHSDYCSWNRFRYPTLLLYHCTKKQARDIIYKTKSEEYKYEKNKEQAVD